MLTAGYLPNNWALPTEIHHVSIAWMGERKRVAWSEGAVVCPSMLTTGMEKFFPSVIDVFLPESGLYLPTYPLYPGSPNHW